MAQRSPYDGLPFYCESCGLGEQEAMACEETDCVMESAAAALARQQREMRIRDLRRQYADLHEQVLAAYRRATNPDICDLQMRETRIVEELHQLGAQPYESAVLSHARAI